MARVSKSYDTSVLEEGEDLKQVFKQHITGFLHLTNLGSLSLCQFQMKKSTNKTISQLTRTHLNNSQRGALVLSKSYVNRSTQFKPRNIYQLEISVLKKLSQAQNRQM